MSFKEQKQFYGTQVWKDCRAAYLKSVNYLCERCKKEGRIVPAEAVHHIKPITPQNINDPNITLNWDNLMAVCRDCHSIEHHPHRGVRRYTVDEFGRVTIKE